MLCQHRTCLERAGRAEGEKPTSFIYGQTKSKPWSACPMMKSAPLVNVRWTHTHAPLTEGNVTTWTDHTPLI